MIEKTIRFQIQVYSIDSDAWDDFQGFRGTEEKAAHFFVSEMRRLHSERLFRLLKIAEIQEP